MTPLDTATYQNHLELAKMLLRQRISINSGHLSLSLNQGHLQIFELLLKSSQSIRKDVQILQKKINQSETNQNLQFIIQKYLKNPSSLKDLCRMAFRDHEGNYQHNYPNDLMPLSLGPFLRFEEI